MHECGYGDGVVRKEGWHDALLEVEEEARHLVAARRRLRLQNELLEVHVDVEEEAEDGDVRGVAVFRAHVAHRGDVSRRAVGEEDALDVGEGAVEERAQQLGAVWFEYALHEAGKVW